MRNNHFEGLNKADNSEQNTFYTGLYYALSSLQLLCFQACCTNKGMAFLSLENVPKV